MDVVYVVTDTISGLKYIGSKKNWLGGRTYFGSPNCKSKRFKKHLIQVVWKEALKSRPDTFQFEVLESYDSVEHDVLLARELYWQKHYDVVRSPNYINAGFAKKGFCGDIYAQMTSDEVLKTKAKVSASIQANMDAMTSAERAEKFGLKGTANGNSGKRWSAQQVQEASDRSKVWFISNTSYKKGKTHEELYGVENAAKFSSRLSESASSRTGEKNHFFGKHHNSETKEAIRRQNKGKKPANTKLVKIGMEVFRGLNEASMATGIKSTTIWHRIHSKNSKYAQYSYTNTEKP